MNNTSTAFVVFSLVSLVVLAAEKNSNLNDVPSDIVVPKMIDGKPSAGKRVRHNWPEENKTSIHHALYLPENWTPKNKERSGATLASPTPASSTTTTMC